jgi:hypothetical protein
MKATDLNKQSISLETIYEKIKFANKNMEYKTHIPHSIFVSDEIKFTLINDGFKVYQGAWDGFMINCLIIEW